VKFNEVHVFSSEDYPDRDAPPLLRPVVEGLYIWFTKDSAYVFGNGWIEWKVGTSIAETLRG
jgi:hypothetical protein